jgi:hypothetical protein
MMFTYQMTNYSLVFFSTPGELEPRMAYFLGVKILGICGEAAAGFVFLVYVKRPIIEGCRAFPHRVMSLAMWEKLSAMERERLSASAQRFETED